MKILRGETGPDSQVRRKRAPDRPWAFRISFPPLVVYRGTPISWPGSGEILVQIRSPRSQILGPARMTLKPFKSQKAEISQIHAKTVAGAGFQPRSGNRAPTPGIGPPDPNPDPDPRFLTALRFPNNFWKNVSARDAFPSCFVLCLDSAILSKPFHRTP